MRKTIGNPAGILVATADQPDVLFRSNMTGVLRNGVSTVSTSTMGTGDQYAIFGMLRIDRLQLAKGIIIPQAVNPNTGESVDWNLGLWTTVINGNDWNPGALVAGAEGTLTMSPVTGNIRGRAITFAEPVAVPRGWYWIGGLYRCNVGVTAGQFYTVGLHRPQAMKNTTPASTSRYDVRSSVVKAYSASSLVNLLSGMSFVDNATYGAVAPQNIDFGLEFV